MVHNPPWPYDTFVFRGGMGPAVESKHASLLFPPSVVRTFNWTSVNPGHSCSIIHFIYQKFPHNDPFVKLTIECSV